MKIISLVFSCVFLSFFSCSKKHVSTPLASYYEANNKLKVLSTISMIDDLVGEIGGEHIDHAVLVTAQLDPHSYELVKGDDEKIAIASLVIGNGLNLEHSASLQYQMDHHPCSMFLGEEIQKRVPNRILEVDGEIDPHIWMDVSIWAEGIIPIVEALSKLDPEHREDYQRNGSFLYQKMLSTHNSILKELKEVHKDLRFLVTSHDAFHYFAKAYLMEDQETDERCVAPEGLSPNGQLSVQDIQRVIDHLNLHHIGVVFPESNVNLDALKKIVASCKHKVKISTKPLYGDAMGEVGSEADSYLKMIQYNAKVLKKEWQALSKSNH